MYALKVLKALQHPDGRYFEPGHDCHALNVVPGDSIQFTYTLTISAGG